MMCMEPLRATVEQEVAISQGVEQGPARITEPSEIFTGMVGGAGRVRTAASQFCRLLP